MNVVTLDVNQSTTLRGPLHGKRILLVEDSATIAAILARMIRGAGGRFRRADGVEAAQRHLRSFRPDILIVDPGLPDGDGLELIAQVARSRFARPHIVVMSGSEVERDARAAGADHFLLKPISRVALISTLVRGPVSLHWQQAGGALGPDLTGSLIADLRRAQLALLEARLAGRTGREMACGLEFVAAVIEAAREPSLEVCRAAAERGALDTVLEELKRWLSKADPVVIQGEAGCRGQGISTA